MVANTLCWLGKVHRERHDYKKSLTRFMEAREIIKSSEGDNSLNLAEIQQNLGVIYDDMDKMEESLNCYFECLKLRRAHFKDDQHNDICETLVCIANIFRKYDLQKSLGIFNIVLNARVKKPLIGKVDGILLLQAYTDVLDVTKEHLELDRKNQKLQNEIAFLLFKTGNVYEKLEQYVEAIAFYNKALKVRSHKKHKTL
jgi:tetratricopeptide (TPR) repeat protein